MENMLRYLFPLFFLVSSCSLFKGQSTLKSLTPEKLLAAVRVTGEGKGRLTLGKHQYVVSYDALIREERDWLLAVAIPLHGEEVLVLSNIKNEKAAVKELNTLEVRINRELPPALRGRVIPEMRSLIRFILAAELGLKRSCVASQVHVYHCSLGKENFELSIADKDIRIKKLASGKLQLVLSAQNLTAPFFAKTEFTFHSQTPTNSEPVEMGLELFWK